jgi:hypothetical protein
MKHQDGCETPAAQQSLEHRELFPRRKAGIVASAGGFLLTVALACFLITWQVILRQMLLLLHTEETHVAVVSSIGLSCIHHHLHHMAPPLQDSI